MVMAEKMTDETEAKPGNEAAPARGAAYAAAKKRAEAKLGFYIHLAVYALVNAILAAVDILNSPQDLWFYWPLGGWGLGLLLHFVLVFMRPLKGPGLKESMIKAELEEMQREAKK